MSYGGFVFVLVMCGKSLSWLLRRRRRRKMKVWLLLSSWLMSRVVCKGYCCGRWPGLVEMNQAGERIR